MAVVCEALRPRGIAEVETVSKEGNKDCPTLTKLLGTLQGTGCMVRVKINTYSPLKFITIAGRFCMVRDFKLVIF